MATCEFYIPEKDYKPAYLALHQRGELLERARVAIEMLADCRLCPRDCGKDRLGGDQGVCKTGRYANIASFFGHMGEENCLRGYHGSGTIFLSQCSLKCVFCQNADISHEGEGDPTGPQQLAMMMLVLQAQGCHNINFVTPSHAVSQILEGLVIAVEAGLRLPIVYNTSAYDSQAALQLLDGVVDIYMPDFKFWDPDLAGRYLRAKDYPEKAQAAVIEMHRQVGDLMMDERGIAKRGVLVRHLVMPGYVDDSEKIMRFLAEDISRDTFVNIMPQYRPWGKVSARRYDEINRRPTSSEYREVIQRAQQAGLWRFDDRRR